MSIGARIKEKRLELGWTTRELAERMGYANQSAISRVERGEVDLQQSRISQFSRVLGVTPGYLMGWEVEPEEAGIVAAKVLKSSQAFQLMQNYFSMDESSQRMLCNIAEKLAAQQKKD